MKKIAFLLIGLSLVAFSCNVRPTASTPTPDPVVVPLTLAPSTESAKTGNNSAVKLTSLSPSSGPVGTAVTLKGQGFLPTGDTIYLNGKPTSATVIANGQIGASPLYKDSTTLFFSASYAINDTCVNNADKCPVQLAPGSVNVYVVNANGTSNTLVFKVTK